MSCEVVETAGGIDTGRSRIDQEDADHESTSTTDRISHVTDLIDQRASAHPTKAFFVRMLTRDISLSDCILDLIDNSVDAAWASLDSVPPTLESSRRLAAFKIDLTIAKDEFTIVDNCGGISLDDAVNYAFTFGRDELGTVEGYSVGVYGIGMKRAVFKLGDDVAVRSTTPDDVYVVKINVPEWLKDNGKVWDFDIDISDPLDETGVEIQVRSLRNETATAFSDPGFVSRLRTTISRDYLLPLMHGLQVSINGRPVEGWDVTFKSSPDFSPMRESYSNGEVDVEIIAGMSAVPPTNTDPSERVRENESGWYVLCNGRVVVAADRTAITVWGRDKFPNWHNQYEGFIGVVLFSSKNSSLLPMTTTKRSIDNSSALYRSALSRMRRPTRAWIDYTNARKLRREEARQKEADATSVGISDIKVRKSIKFPDDISGGSSKDANVLYTVQRARLRRLARAFGKTTMAYKEVGVRSFEYSYDRLVDEDE